MKVTRKIIQLPDGKYVKDWQYSQGYFDVVSTEDIFEAEDFTGNEINADVFFKREGKLLTVELIANIKETRIS